MKEISFNLYDKFKHITLIDISKGMIDTLKNKIQDSGVKNMTAIQILQNIELAVKDEYDVIYTSMALHHVIDVRAILNSMYKLLIKK